MIKSKIKNYFNKKHGVLSVYLFGSMAEGRENRFSDVDIAVLFDDRNDKRQYTQLCLLFIDDLSRILNKNVDIVVLNKASSFLKFQILRNGVKIYEAEERDNHDFEAMTIIEYFDFLPIRKRMETALISNIINGV